MGNIINIKNRKKPKKNMLNPFRVLLALFSFLLVSICLAPFLILCICTLPFMPKLYWKRLQPAILDLNTALMDTIKMIESTSKST